MKVSDVIAWNFLVYSTLIVFLAYISTLSTLIPQSAVASSNKCWNIYKFHLQKIRFVNTCIAPAILSLSLRISWRFFVPKMFLNEVCANNLQFEIIFAYFCWQPSLLCAVVGVLYIGHAHDGIGHAVVDHRVHGHCHAVLSQKLENKSKFFIFSQFSCFTHLLWGNTKCDSSEINFFVRLNTWQDNK